MGLVGNMYGRTDEQGQVIAGRNAVMEALRAGHAIDSVLIQKGERQGQILKIMAICKQEGIVLKETAKEKLDFLSGNINHQGIVAVLSACRYASIEEVFEKARQSGAPPFIVICDEIADPHNLGAIIRTAEAAGAHGVIIPKRRSAGLTAATAKAACGALEYLPVVRVPNLSGAIETLKKQNIFVYGADMDGKSYRTLNFTGGTALVIGSEGTGMRRLVKEKCDEIVSLPMFGKVQSLNASVACGILLYEIAYQRNSG